MQNLYEKITLGDPRQHKLPFCLWTLNIVRVVLKNEYGITLRQKFCKPARLNHMGLSPHRLVFIALLQSKSRNGKMENYLQKTFPELKAPLAKQTGASIFFIDESSARSDHHRGTCDMGSCRLRDSSSWEIVAVDLGCGLYRQSMHGD